MPAFGGELPAALKALARAAAHGQADALRQPLPLIASVPSGAFGRGTIVLVLGRVIVVVISLFVAGA